ncbi:MAG TPA: hypothetical protein VKQ07_01515 [Jatrophihabitantaceae bacterium]|nr:hypothetical protein [Jatrophihabitantaceae bacterium]
MGRHRGAFWTSVAIGAALFVGGAGVAYVGYEHTAGPAGAVKGYFTALEHSDAKIALAYGDLPADGSRVLLTSTVLREQQHIAPISDVQASTLRQSGNTATVRVTYDLGFSTGRLAVSDTVSTVRRGGSWHLERAAALTRLFVLQAGNRATIVGAPIPDGPLLVFPGAAPIRLDSPYLQVDADTSTISLSSNVDTSISVEVSDAGRIAARAALSSALRSCVTLGAHADPRCPIPARTVPGTLHAALAANVVNSIGIVVTPDNDGVLQMTGTIKLNGRYDGLDFNNVASTHRGTFTLQVNALAFAQNPIVLRWQEPTS